VGPGEFISYAEDTEDLIQSHSLALHLYVDDTQLLSIKQLKEITSRKAALEDCVSSVLHWCAQWRLQSGDMTELIWCASRTNLQKPQTIDTTIQVGPATIKPVDNVRNLGVTLDSQLNMCNHISTVFFVQFFLSNYDE